MRLFHGGKGDVALQAVDLACVLGSIALIAWGLSRDNGMEAFGLVLFAVTTLAFIALRSSVDQHTEWTGRIQPPVDYRPGEEPKREPVRRAG